MSKITNRISRYLITRQRRAARLEIFERAVEAEILEQHLLGDNDHSGTIWQLAPDQAAKFSSDPDRDRELIRSALEASARNWTPAGLKDQTDRFGEFGSAYDFDLPDEDLGNVSEVAQQSHAATADNSDQVPADLDDATAAAEQSSGDTVYIAPNRSKPFAALRDHVLPLIAGFAHSLKPTEVATALLLARAVGHDEPTLDRLISALDRKWPIVVVQIPVHDFVRHFGLMLEEGLILPVRTSLCSILPGPTLSGRHKPLADVQRRRSIECMSGAYVRRADAEEFRRIISKNILTLAKPVLVADERADPLPSRLTAAADITIKGDGIDAYLIADVLAICCDIPASRSLFLIEEVGFEPIHLGIDDLAVAIRPGRSLVRMLGVLMMLEDENASNAEDAEGDDRGGSAPGRSSKSSVDPKRAAQRKKLAGCFDVIEPAATGLARSEVASSSPGEAAGAVSAGQSFETCHTANSLPARKANGKDHLLVENLSGYGEAKEWALDLKLDLRAWQNGEVDWVDLSTRLLLSGPPGTGKTTFAKALCNTLQVPLIATSVARWLEASHLGDVLSAMKDTFEHASQVAPCILFVDEIDNIGNRGGGSDRHYDDYWCSLVNRLLELLDGASKTEGVIVVGATNRAEKIDAALLRSGRLERHIIIPPPDTEALVGIIAHHLGPDLDVVLNSKAANGLPKLADAVATKTTLPGSGTNDDRNAQFKDQHKGVISRG